MDYGRGITVMKKIARQNNITTVTNKIPQMEKKPCPKA